MKPKILLISDVENWGGWTRAQAIIQYLSDAYDFTLTTLKPVDDSLKFEDKTYLNYDAYWLLFHTMIQYPRIQKLMKDKLCIATITSNTIIKPDWILRVGNSIQKAKEDFSKWSQNINLMLINNLRIESEIKQIYKGVVRYAPRGVDADLFYPVNWNFDSFKAIYVGKPTKEKGLEKYIKPCCKSTNTPLILNTRNFTDAFPYNEMYKQYNEGHVLIVASTSDGTPNTALEMAACGRPIISNYIGNMPEFIKDGVNGFMVNLNLDEYIKSLTWLKNNQKEAFRMGLEARKTIMQGWQWHQLLNKNERKYLNELFGGKNG